MTIDAGPTEFSPAGYAALLGGLRDRGYAVRSFAAAQPEQRHLILRHDIDFSLAAALAMAEQESALGIAATYFILLRTEFYNPLSGAGLDAIRRVAALGHAIGLHFDAALYPDADDLNGAVARECDLLAGALGVDVPLVSLHRPGASGLVTNAGIGRPPQRLWGALLRGRSLLLGLARRLAPWAPLRACGDPRGARPAASDPSLLVAGAGATACRAAAPLPRRARRLSRRRTRPPLHDPRSDCVTP